MRLSSLTELLLLSFFALKSQPATWQPRGVSSGGALFSPAINPAKTDEFFVACDLWAMFHTTGLGRLQPSQRAGLYL